MAQKESDGLSDEDRFQLLLFQVLRAGISIATLLTWSLDQMHAFLAGRAVDQRLRYARASDLIRQANETKTQNLVRFVLPLE